MKVRHLKSRVRIDYPAPPHNPFIRKCERRRQRMKKNQRFAYGRVEVTSDFS